MIVPAVLFWLQTGPCDRPMTPVQLAHVPVTKAPEEYGRGHDRGDTAKPQPGSCAELLGHPTDDRTTDWGAAEEHHDVESHDSPSEGRVRIKLQQRVGCGLECDHG